MSVANRIAPLFWRWLAFAAGPWIVVILFGFLSFVTLYVSLPALLPFTAYGRTEGFEPTVFSLDRLGWLINIAYSAVVSVLGVWFGRRMDFIGATALFVVILLACALVVHALMLSLGYDYWYDTP
jgi:hypothetical protein